MTDNKAFTTLNRSGRMRNNLLYSICLLLFLTLLPVTLNAQDEPEYDEVLIYVEIPRIGGGELVAVIKDEEVFLPLIELFDFLKVKNEPSADMNTLTGFFISQESEYIIDRENNRITYQDRVYNLEPGDLVRSEQDLFLRALHLGKIFGLNCKFNFRTLSVKIETELELPIIREMKQEALRRNLSRLKGDIIADTTIGRTYPGFSFGMADWSVISTEQINGPAEARLNLKLGAAIMGGEATASLNYYTSDPFKEKQQYYLWRYVNNDQDIFKQVMAGKIVSQSTSSIFDPVVGVQVTNTPSTFRRSFGSYTLSDKTEPGWIVELYVNNVLVDYTKADASGFFTFEVPMVYGNSMVKVKYYGPWGEEESHEQNINIPYNFVPYKKLEYTASAGMVEDTLHSFFSRGNVGYGLTRSVTVGGGIEYLSSVSSGPFMPFLSTSLRVTNNLLVSGEYMLGVRAKGVLTYRLPSNMQLDLNYARYHKDQKAISYNYLEERKAALSVPFRIKKTPAYSRFTLYQIVLPTTNYTTGELLFSAPIYGVGTNLTTYALFIGNADPNIYSNLSLSVKLPLKITLMPQAQYSYTDQKFISAKMAMEKHLYGSGFINISYEQNFRSNLKMGEIGFRYDFSFAQAGSSARVSNAVTTLTQYARGSVISDKKTGYLKADRRNNVGRGGITVIPYLDLNDNMRRDPGEPKAVGLNLHSTGGHQERLDKDTTIRVLGLEPYTKYFIEVDEAGFENISWKLYKNTYSVVVDPNQLKILEIPVAVEGEASGMVSVERDGESWGIGRILVNFYKLTNKQVGRALTEEDGYYSLFGLAPGSYYARVDTSQLRKLKMTSEPDSLFFRIRSEIEGDYIDGIDFILKPIAADMLAADTTEAGMVIEEVVTKDTTYLIVHEVTRESVTIKEDYLSIQLGAFKRKANAEALKKKLAAILDKKVEIIVEDGYYKVRITGFEDREELDAYIPVLQSQGINEMWVISARAMKDWITTLRRDSVAKVSEVVTRRPLHVSVDDMTIQAGAFRDEKNAIALRDDLAGKLGKPVTIVYEDGYYKVRITGFADATEMVEILPDLSREGFKDIWVIYPKEPREGPAITDTLFIDNNLILPRDTIVDVSPETVSLEPVIELPRFVLHAAIFYKQLPALRAQKRITRKLKVPVEIIKDWDAYRVVITGFYTREETYLYYPELAGLGYSNIFVFEREPQKK